jgi:hypothetical protein
VHYLRDLAKYNFKLIHKPGGLNRANHLSRQLDYNKGKEDNAEVQVLQDHMFSNVVVLPCSMLSKKSTMPRKGTLQKLQNYRRYIGWCPKITTGSRMGNQLSLMS